MPRTGEFTLQSASHLSLCSPHCREEQLRHRPSKGQCSQTGCNEAFQTPSPVPTEPNAAWTEWAKPPTAIGGKGRMLKSSRVHRVSSLSSSKQLPGQWEGNVILQSIRWVEWGNGWNLLTLFLQEVRWYDPNSPFWLQNLWTSLWAYWGVSCTCGEPISSLNSPLTLLTSVS